MSQEYNTYVLTSDGFKELSTITQKDFVYDANGQLGKVTYRCTYPITDETQFSLVHTSVDALPFVIKNDTQVDVVTQSLIKQVLPFSSVQVDSWLFHPWVHREQINFRTSIDLSKTATNFYDIKYIYLFNNRILKISEDLGISQKAVKEILIREAAEYEEHIPAVYDYIKENFKIDCEPPEGSIESFKDFKHFVKNNFVFKMNRYMDIDLNFISFAISTLTRCRINKTAPTSKSYVYELAYRFYKESDKDLVDKLLSFAKKLDIKYEYKETDTHMFVNIFNKPLFDFVMNSLLIDISCIINSTIECQEYFVNNIFKNNTSVLGCRKLVLQIKELCLYHKKVVKILEHPEGYSAQSAEDDFDELDSTLIVTEEGYYSRVMSKQTLPYNSGTQYTYFETQDKSTILLGYTRRK